MTAPAPQGRRPTAQEPAPPGAGADALAQEPPAPGASEHPSPAGAEELAALVAERDEYLEALQRTQAEFENYRRRVDRDRAVAAEAARHQFVGQLLPVLDNLERAVEALGGAGSEVVTGLEMVIGQLAAVVADAGVSEMKVAPGDAFDPSLHEAIGREHSGDHPEGAVTQVVQKGYLAGDAALRPARVLVAGPQAPAADGT